MVRFGYEMYGVVAFMCDGLFYRIAAKRTVATYNRKGRELPLYCASSNATQIEAEEFGEYRKTGVHVFCKVEECEIPTPEPALAEV